MSLSPDIKTTQALNFITIGMGGQVDEVSALKLLFFADRFHLRKYGRLIAQDEYWAMKRGPVASRAKCIAEFDREYAPDAIAYAEDYLAPARNGREIAIRSKQPVDERVFSKSDMEALSFSLDTFKDKDANDLVELTHRYPEWKTHEEILKTEKRDPIDILEFLLDAPESENQCYSLTAEDKLARQEQLCEDAVVAAMWC